MHHVVKQQENDTPMHHSKNKRNDVINNTGVAKMSDTGIISLYEEYEDEEQEKTINVPEGCGIMFELRTCTIETGVASQADISRQRKITGSPENFDVQVILHTSVPDQHYAHIHPHCHGPANMQDVRLLHGGGSGTAVFHGECVNNSLPTLGSIVMKHGGAKDAKEVFSLVTIRQELKRRAILQQQTVLKNEALAAAERMRQKIPEFVMVYISPYHLRNRYEELWHSLRRFIIDQYHADSNTSLDSITEDESSSFLPNMPKARKSKTRAQTISLVDTCLPASLRSSVPLPPPRSLRSQSEVDKFSKPRRSSMSSFKPMSIMEKQAIHDKEKTQKRSICIRISKEQQSWTISKNIVEVVLHSNLKSFHNGVKEGSSTDDKKIDTSSYLLEDGMDGLQDFATALREELNTQQWKVTLGQKTIGGPNPENGAHALTSGKLVVQQCVNNNYNNNSPMENSPFLLQKLVIEFSQVMEDLSTLTYARERRGERMNSIFEHVAHIKEMYIRSINQQKDRENAACIESYDNYDCTYDNYSNLNEVWDYLIPLVSKDVDLYVGSAIRKNFEPITGRFTKLRQFAIDLHFDALLLEDTQSRISSTSTVFSHQQLQNEEDEFDEHPISKSISNSALDGSVSSENWVFTKEEETPARFLAVLLYKKELVTDFNPKYDHNDRGGICNVFANPPTIKCALDLMEERGWFDLLEHATSFAHDESLSSEAKSAALDCIWTCGLTDAGLHNTFVQQERGLELFDLGAPRLEPQPAFLTKFLMSFFHALGMEEDEETNGAWVRRFTVIKKETRDLLELTDKTKELIPYIHDAFQFALDHFIKHIFYNNERVRALLLKYVILQLLSDSAFCICRWEEKGGGSERYGDELQKKMEKWLWRSLWDQYIACYVYANLLLPCENNIGKY